MSSFEKDNKFHGPYGLGWDRFIEFRRGLELDWVYFKGWGFRKGGVIQFWPEKLFACLPVMFYISRAHYSSTILFLFQVQNTTEVLYFSRTGINDF